VIKALDAVYIPPSIAMIIIFVLLILATLAHVKTLKLIVMIGIIVLLTVASLMQDAFIIPKTAMITTLVLKMIVCG
jgi:hypothetical protein